MASCFRGLADDWSAMFFNPGGLTQLDSKWTIGGSVGIIMPRADYTAHAYPLAPFPGMYTNEREVANKNFYVPSFGIFFKPSEKIVLGLGVYAPFGLGTEWDLLDLPDYFGNAEGISKVSEHNSDHQVINIQPTAAIKLTDKISVGLGVSYIWGKMDLDMVKLIMNPLTQEVPGIGFTTWQLLQYQFGQQGLQLPDLTTDQKNRIPVESNLSGTGSSYGFNFGIHIALSEKFSFGLSGRYCTDLKLSGPLAQTIIGNGDALKYGMLDAVPAVVYADPTDPTDTGEETKKLLTGIFASQYTPEENDAEADLPLPMTIGGGIAFKPSPKLTLTADVSWTNWASWDEIIIRVEGGDNRSMKENWVNTIEMGAGFELLVMESETKQIFLRGGFYTVDTPVPDETISPTILDPGRRNVITGGLGLNMGKIAFNFVGEYILFAKRDVPAAQYTWDPDTGMADNYAGLYNATAYVFTLGTTISL